MECPWKTSHPQIKLQLRRWLFKQQIESSKKLDGELIFILAHKKPQYTKKIMDLSLLKPHQ